MTEPEIARLEERLHLTLPARYVDIARRLGEDVQGLRGLLGKGVHRPLIYSGEELLEVNELVRRDSAFTCTAPAEFAQGWPAHYLVCGYERAGTIYYVLDTRQSDARILQILAKKKTLEPCEAYPTLDALADYALAKYREFSAKTKGGKAKPAAPRASPAADRPKPDRPKREPAATSKSADAKAVSAMRKLLEEAGFTIEPPKRKHSLEELTADIAPELPEELRALYTVCDGGKCQRLGYLRILSLADAARDAKTFCDWRPTMGFFPIADEVNSDPCCVCTAGPLKGYVVFVNHDGLDFILARSLSRFLQILARTPASADWSLEDAMYNPAPPRHVPFEFAGPERTAADLRAARELLQIAETRVGAGDEYGHLFEIALKLFTEKQTDEIAALLNHRDHEVRRVAQQRLAEFNSPQAAAALGTADDELAAFVEKAVGVLKQAGLDATVVDRTQIRIDPGPVWLNVPMFFDRRDQADVWDFLVERAKTFVSLEE